MPNWCEGNLRIRGKREDIMKFLENEIIYFTGGIDNEVENKPKIENTKYETFLSKEDVYGYESFYIRNTFRNFIFSDTIQICWPDAEPEEEVIVFINDFNSAWALREDGWADHAKKYNIDFHMFGYERGMQFSQEMTVHRDGYINKETTQYDDWDWDCPFPDLGG